MSEENKAIVRKLMDQVWSGGNPTAVDELLSTEIVRREPGEEAPLRGLEEYKERVTFFRTAFPDLVVSFDEAVAEGSKVAVRWTASGTQKGALGDVPASNRRFETSGCSIMRIENGRITDEYATWDSLGFMQQLGAVPK